MSDYYTVLTDVGQAKLSNAIALGQTLQPSQLAVGDGGGVTPVPDPAVTALVGEHRRAGLNQIFVDADNPNYIVCEQVIPEDVGGWWIREVGIFDIDGDLIAYGNFPPTYKPLLSEGSGRTQTIRVVLMVSDTAAIELKIDPSVVLATRKYVDDERTEHEASRAHPAATTTAQGMVELATNTEAKGKLLSTRTLTPANLAALAAAADFAGLVELATDAEAQGKASAAHALTPANLAALGATEALAGLVELATDAEAQGLTDALRAITPATLHAALQGGNQSLMESGYQKLPGGLIVQWGLAPASATGHSATNTVTATFPIAFPTAGLLAVSSFVDPHGSCSIGNSAPTAIDMSVSYANQSGGTKTLQGRYIVVGY